MIGSVNGLGKSGLGVLDSASATTAASSASREVGLEIDRGCANKELSVLVLTSGLPPAPVFDLSFATAVMEAKDDVAELGAGSGGTGGGRALLGFPSEDDGDRDLETLVVAIFLLTLAPVAAGLLRVPLKVADTADLTIADPLVVREVAERVLLCVSDAPGPSFSFCLTMGVFFEEEEGDKTVDLEGGLG